MKAGDLWKKRGSYSEQTYGSVPGQKVGGVEALLDVVSWEAEAWRHRAPLLPSAALLTCHHTCSPSTLEFPRVSSFWSSEQLGEVGERHVGAVPASKCG